MVAVDEFVVKSSYSASEDPKIIMNIRKLLIFENNEYWMPFMEGCLCLLERFLFLSIRRLFHLVFT